MKRQVGIASAGRAASTSLYRTIVAALEQAGRVFPIWEHSSGERLAQAYAQPELDYIVIKSETFHFMDRLERRDQTTLIVLTRNNHLRQVVSHVVSLRSGRFHQTPGTHRATPFRMLKHEFLMLAHMVLTLEQYVAQTDLGSFDVVERWVFEDLVADFPGHLARIGLAGVPVHDHLGVSYDSSTIINADEVMEWARALEPQGFRAGSL